MRKPVIAALIAVALLLGGSPVQAAQECPTRDDEQRVQDPQGDDQVDPLSADTIDILPSLQNTLDDDDVDVQGLQGDTSTATWLQCLVDLPSAIQCLSHLF